MAVAPSLGWSGKLPCRGDFIEGGARLPVFKWIADWASAGMVAIRRGGGPATDRFLTAPLTSFATSAGAMGPEAALGVIGPGMDRTGRLYPFSIAAACPGDIDAGETLRANTDWLTELEEIFLGCLAPDFDPARLEGMTEALAVSPPALVPADGTPAGTAVRQDGQQPVLSPRPPDFAVLFGPEPVTGAPANVGG